MTDLPVTPTIETALFATMGSVIGDVLDSAGLAILRGPVGIGKSFALRHVVDALESNGNRVFNIAATGALEGKTIEFCRAIHRREGVSSSEGLELAFEELAGHPFRSYGRRVVLVVDEAQELKNAIIAMLRGLWDRGDLARLGQPNCPAFGLVLVGNDQFLAGGTRRDRVDLLPLWDRVTHNIRLPRPSKADQAAFAAALYPESDRDSAELRDIVQGFGEELGSFRAAAKAARQAHMRASRQGVPVAPEHLKFAIRMMGGR